MPLVGRESVGLVVAVLAGIVLFLTAFYRLLQMSEITSAIAFILVGSIAGSLWWGFGPRFKRYLKARERLGSGSQTAHQVQMFLGQDDLVRELERVAAWCEQFRDRTISAQDVPQVTRELDHLWIELVELKSKYGGVWTLTLREGVTTVGDQIQAASSALSKRLGEKTKAHVEDACQDAKSLIRELKAPPSS